MMAIPGPCGRSSPPSNTFSESLPAATSGMIVANELAAVAVLRRRGGGAARHARGRAAAHLAAAAEPADPGARGRARPAAVRAPRPRHRAHRVRALLRE